MGSATRTGTGTVTTGPAADYSCLLPAGYSYSYSYDRTAVTVIGHADSEKEVSLPLVIMMSHAEPVIRLHLVP